MAFASVDDIANRLGRDLSGGETTSVELLLEGATAVIANAADKDDDWATDLEAATVPRILKFVCIEAVCRALANPSSLQSLQEALGQASYSARFGPGLMLTDSEQLLVRREVYGTGSGSSRPEGFIEELHDFYYGS